MTKTEKRKQEVKAFFLARGNWTEDRYGNLIREAENGKRYRLKFGDKVVRYEVECIYETSTFAFGVCPPKKKDWVRIRSAYYNKLILAPNGNTIGWEK